MLLTISVAAADSLIAVTNIKVFVYKSLGVVDSAINPTIVCADTWVAVAAADSVITELKIAPVELTVSITADVSGTAALNVLALTNTLSVAATDSVRYTNLPVS